MSGLQKSCLGPAMRAVSYLFKHKAEVHSNLSVAQDQLSKLLNGGMVLSQLPRSFGISNAGNNAV